MTAAEIARALGGHRSGNGWMARCPAHDDHTPSLSIGESNGRPLIHCHAGCDFRDVMAAIRQHGCRTTNLLKSKEPPPPPPNGPPDHVWDYRDESGAVVRKTARWNLPNGRKMIRPLTPDGAGGWCMVDMCELRPLYRLPELIERCEAPVIVLEGERTADAVATMLPEYVATTASGGANAAAQTDWTPLRGRDVVVWPDADTAGAKYAADVARLAREAGAASVKVVALPPDLADKWDLADALPDGWTTATVCDLINQAESPSELVSVPPESIADILSAAGLDTLREEMPADEIASRMRALGPLTTGLDEIGRGALRVELMRLLKSAKITGAAAMVDAALVSDPARQDDNANQGRSLLLEDPTPWPEDVDGADLLAEIRDALSRYIVLPARAAIALALWVLHTHAVSAAYISPILAITSPQKRCGKTTLLELLTAMVLRPLPASNITAAALFRAIEAYQPTLLVDEADTFLAAHDELRGILNSGHTRTSAQVVRTVGDDHKPRVFGTFGPKVIAAIGALPGTIEDRAIVIRMQRRATGEQVERMRRDRLVDDMAPIRQKAARWAADHLEFLRNADPPTPSGLHDRAADNWRALLAIADAAGADWAELARAAANELSGSDESLDNEAGVMLLADLRDLFAARGVDKIASAKIVEHLATLDTRPWPEWRGGRPITARGISKLLAPFGVKPKSVRLDGESTAKGYHRSDFDEPWTRYIPPADSSQVRHTGTTPVGQGVKPHSHPSHRPTRDGSDMPSEPVCDNACADVTDKNAGSWELVV